MIVRLTGRQFEAFGDYVPADIAHLFAHDTAPAAEQSIAVRAPYVAWEIALEEISVRTFTRSTKAAGASKRLRSLLTRISKPMNILLVHPALKGQAMVGHEASIIPAWQIETDKFGRSWLPSIRNVDNPDPNSRFELLCPNWSMNRGLEVTTWGPQSSLLAPPLWIYDRALNEALSQRTALPALRPALPSAAPS
jgi:hypothetical protein